MLRSEAEQTGRLRNAEGEPRQGQELAAESKRIQIGGDGSGGAQHTSPSGFTGDLSRAREAAPGILNPAPDAVKLEHLRTGALFLRYSARTVTGRNHPQITPISQMDPQADASRAHADRRHDVRRRGAAARDETRTP